MAKRKQKEYELAEVIWIDAEEHGDTGWNSLREQLAYAKKSCPSMRTVGYIVYEGPEHIALLSTIGDKECSTVEKIPRAFIKSINPLTRTSGARKAAEKPIK
jgi:hypothetical protein|tara:strand:+ start:2751 stop:3056 length:306 start_codon:yes stop_codon:yes gene_type:complete